MRSYKLLFRKITLSSLLLFSILLLNQSFLLAQLGLGNGQWRAYLNHSNALQTAEFNGILYSITLGGMFSFDPVTQERQTFSTVEGLHDINPTRLYHDAAQNILYVGFADGTINFFEDPQQIRTITDISRNTNFTAKAINDFVSDAQFLYVATEFGVVIFNLATRLPAFTVTQFGNNASRLPVENITLYNDRIWAKLERGQLFSAPIGFPNLSDPSIWTLENGLDGLPAGNSVLEARGNTEALFARFAETVYVKQNGTWSIDPRMDERVDKLYTQPGLVAVSRLDRITSYVNGEAPLTFFIVGNVEHVFRSTTGQYYVAKTFRGVDRTTPEGIVNITPSGPASNISTEIATYNGEIYVAPRGYNSSFTPVPDGSGVYFFSPETGWSNLNRDGGLDPDRVNTGFARAFLDPSTRDAYLGSFGRGLVQLRNGELQAFYDCENSGLSTRLEGVCITTDLFTDTRVSGMHVDQRGNLWVSQTFAQEPLVMRTPEGNWIQVDESRFRTSTEFIGMVGDELGSKWIINRRKGLVVYNDNFSPEDLSDDRVVTINPIRTNRDDECDPSNEALALAVDLDGFVWVGTSKGVVVYFDPFSIANGELVEGTRPVFNGRCLLENERILSIAVDGANRKWFGTENGAFLINETGEEQIQQFTTQNSPLLSDRVNHIAVDQATGQVLFSTDKGIIGYQGDATESQIACDEVFVYPNPLFTDFDGEVVIRGSARGSRVKIVTVSGRLVKELIANGGTSTWDGRDLQGNKVASGIYLALMANDEGENPCIGKFAVIQR
ncbi:MAG: hypothetical protein AAF694_17135 [Bacteroidota bacterium]